ncbi:hypothetical protein B0H16DRAFT_1475969 [Mycena metata]|uniref:Uncharacterized protein n=1 Tax=Mycena metata TaxID=1033252 RepID=A0AAD7HCJ9_9AGAR|nr:hypothetical protein B0H16DRAFT_1475969 [Mycena metata]
MAVRDLFTPSNDEDEDSEDEGDAEGDLLAKEAQLRLDLAILEAIKSTRYLQGRTPVPKSGNLHLAWEYAANPEDHGRFQGMLRVSPCERVVLQTKLFSWIEDRGRSARSTSTSGSIGSSRACTV